MYNWRIPSWVSWDPLWDFLIASKAPARGRTCESVSFAWHPDGVWWSHLVRWVSTNWKWMIVNHSKLWKILGIMVYTWFLLIFLYRDIFWCYFWVSRKYPWKATWSLTFRCKSRSQISIVPCVIALWARNLNEFPPLVDVPLEDFPFFSLIKTEEKTRKWNLTKVTTCPEILGV